MYRLPTTARLRLIGNAVHKRHAHFVVQRLVAKAVASLRADGRPLQLRVLELFAGAGVMTSCIHQAAAAAGATVNRVVVVEWDGHAAAVLRHTHPTAEVLEADVSSLSWQRGEFDIVMAGPPCQDYSGANQRRDRGTSGLVLPRGALLPVAVNAIATVAPRAWVIENVRMHAADFAAASGVIAGALPDCRPAVQLCAARDFGAAMMRQRLFWSDADLSQPPPPLPAVPWAASAEELAADAPPHVWQRRCQRGARSLSEYMHEEVRGRPRHTMRLHRDVELRVQATVTSSAHKGAPYSTVRDTAARLGGVNAQRMGMAVDDDGAVWRPMLATEAEALMELSRGHTEFGVKV